MADGIPREQRRDVLVATLLLSILIGLSLGALGGGGSMLTVPVLTYVAREPPVTAVAMSLFVVCSTSVVAAATYARRGRVRWSAALAFGPSGMVGAFIGGRLSVGLSPQTTVIAFAIAMTISALAMLWRSRIPMHGREQLAVTRTVVAGVAVGLVTGVLGTGGGFLVLPALVLIAGIPIEEAVGTSLVVIALQSAASLGGRLGHITIDWQLACAIALVAVAGALLGGRISRRVAAVRLQRTFSVFVLVVALAMLVGELA